MWPVSLCFSIRRCPSKFMYVWIWENFTLHNYKLNVAHFSSVTPLSLLFSRKISFQIVGLKILSLPTSALIKSTRILMWYSDSWTFYFLLFIILGEEGGDMDIQNNVITPPTSQYHTQLHIHLNCWHDFLMHRIPVPNSWFSSPFNISCTPTKFN
jgi:hypothetical protein